MSATGSDPDPGGGPAGHDRGHATLAEPAVDPLVATVPYRARFDECGPDARLRASAILRWAQDVAWIHSERLGFGREWYAERDMAWVVRGIELTMVAPILMGATADVETRVTGMRRVMVRRRTEIRARDGSVGAWVDTDWVMTDVRRGLPARVPEEFPALFGVPPGGFAPTRVPLPGVPSDAFRRAVSPRPQELDPMAHVNNAVYVDWLDEALQAVGSAATATTLAFPRTYHLEYLVPAASGAELVATCWAMDDGAWAYRLATSDGTDFLRGTLAPG